MEFPGDSRNETSVSALLIISNESTSSLFFLLSNVILFSAGNNVDSGTWPVTSIRYLLVV